MEFRVVEEKENESTISKCFIPVQEENIMICTESSSIMGVEGQSKGE
jgi:hypothetical protein